jgi:DNA-binding GntR family transcriptional regulator
MARPVIETRTLAEQIAERLREEVLTGRLAAGERVSQEALAERYAVSRVPVRDALRILHGEGLVSADPRFGTTIAPLTTHDLDELYEMRVALEPATSRLATPHLRPQDFEEMRSHLDVMRTSELSSPPWFDAHAAFHRTLNERSGRARMCALVDRLRAQTERYVRVYHELEWPSEELIDDHARVLAAAEGGDPEVVADVVRDHLQVVRRRIFQHLEAAQALTQEAT